MKRRNSPHLRPFLSLVICVSVTAMPGSITAATNQYWNPGGSGGDGIWGTSPGDKNWNLVAGAAGNTVWPDTNNDVAVFQDSIGGTVTVFTPVQAAGLVQNGADYSINAGTITLVRDSALKDPFISVQSGNLSVDSVLAGTNGLTKDGRGNLTLSGTNIYTGTTTVNFGTLTLEGSLASAALTIGTRSNLLDSSGGLGDGTLVTNRGVLTVNAAETVLDYTQLGNGILEGGADLTVTGVATLGGGIVRSSLLGETISTGNVTVSGSLGGGNLAITGSRLTLEGTSTNSSVGISAGAVLDDKNGGLMSNATVANAGTFAVNSAQTISTYTQTGNGSLSGPAILTTTGGSTLTGGTISGNLRGDTTTTGDVRIEGTIGDGTLSVKNGNLTLAGTSTNRVVNIEASGSLFDYIGALDPSAIVTNAGILHTVSPESITSYTQNDGGRLDGQGYLTVTGGATLKGGTVNGGLLGDINSTGNVVIIGTLGGGALSVTSGTLTLGGSSLNSTVSISAGASLEESLGGFAADTVLTNAGNLSAYGGIRVATYVQNANGTLSGPESLTTFDRAILNGGTVQGTLLGHTISNGDVLVSGALGEGSLEVTGGTLTLNGIADNGSVKIAQNTTLKDVNGGLSPEAEVSNAGTLQLATPEEVSSYISNGGLLKGHGKLSVSKAVLNSNSSLAGSLEAGTLIARGAVSITGKVVAETFSTRGTVSISGKAIAETIRIKDGILINTGLLGSNSADLDIASGATLVAGGTQRYGVLTSSSTGAGQWRGDLNNSATIAPGGKFGFGTLGVTGKLNNGSSGVLQMDVGSTGNDLLAVGGTSHFGGMLAVNQSGPGQIAAFVPVQLFAASDYKGNFTSFWENLEGTVFFNPENGTITRLGSDSGPDNFLSAVSRNQKSTWIALYDDVIDPGKQNVTRDPDAPSGYDITGGIADQKNPDLLQALSASLTPAGLDINLLNHLSAEVYSAVLDYAMQATRQHQRTALSAPALSPRAQDDSKSGIASSAKSSAKDAIPPPPTSAREWEFFAAADYFHAKTDSSNNNANYDLSGAGLVAGARNQLSDRFQLAGYVAADDGRINGSLIDSDQSGWSLGLIGETVIDAKSRTILTTAISYGRYVSDGTRESAATTSTGWTPDRVHFSDIDSDSLELYAGLETTVYQDERFRVIPTAGLRYSTGSMDGFSESTGSAVGSPIALNVSPENYDNWILEMGVAADAKLSEQFTLQGQLGFNAGIGNDSHEIHSSFAKGNRGMRAEADGLTDNLFYLGAGLEYRVNGDFTIGLGYRSEFRPSHPIEQSCNLSSAFRF